MTDSIHEQDGPTYPEGFADRVAVALVKHRGVFLPAFLQIAAEVWEEGGNARMEKEHSYGREEKAKFSNPYRTTN